VASRFAYVSMGQIYVKSGDAPAAPYESKFVQGVRDRAVELYRRHSWKAGDSDGKMIPRAALWGANARNPELARIEVNCISPRGEGDGFTFSVVSREISGVLAYKEEAQAELRLLHTADYRITQVISEAGTGRLALSMLHDGCSVIATMDGNGGVITEVTQGEAFDESPYWIPGQKNQILFQSAGVANNENGAVVGQAPYSIRLLDMDSAQITTLLEDPSYDFLGPKMSTDRTLYFIRRPYRMGPQPRSFFGWIEDILLFPYRLLYAIFQFFNLFTMMYTGKPLMHSGPLAKKQADPARMIIWGNLVEAQKALMGTNKTDSGLVPASWELCRKTADGETEVLAKSVLSYDLESDGGVLFTNGNAIYRTVSAGGSTLLEKASLIRQVVALPPYEMVETASPSHADTSETAALR